MNSWDNACIYLDGVALWISMLLFFILVIGFIIMGMGYLEAERKADRLNLKYRRTKAELHNALVELETTKRKELVVNQDRITKGD